MTVARPPRAVTRRRLAGVVAAALALLVGAARAQLHPRGGEFQVNQSTLFEINPAVAAAEDGSFVVVWLSQAVPYFGEQDIAARRYDGLGATLGAQFQLDPPAEAYYCRPVITAAPGGGAIVGWHGTDASGLSILARRLDAAGTPLGLPFQVNTYTTNHQGRPAIAVEADGDFVVAWQSYGQIGSAYGIVARRFDSTGAAATAEFQVGTRTIGQNQGPTVGALANGEFVIAWTGKAEAGFYYPVLARRFDATGVPQAVELQVSDATGGIPFLPAIAARGDGGFVIVWESFTGGDPAYAVLVRRYDSAGVALGPAFPVSPGGSNPQSEAAIAMDSSGEFVVAWQSYAYAPNTGSVYARRFDSSGSGIGTEFQINTFTGAVDQFPSVATDGSGHYTIAWYRSVIDTAQMQFVDHAIHARRFGRSLATIDVDGDGDTNALTDALLVLRQRFGFTGAALVAGALGGDCTRCDAAAIESYIASLELDVDGDGSVGALTDALLILRFAFGFRGSVLITAAVAEECTRCGAEPIEAFLLPLFA